MFFVRSTFYVSTYKEAAQDRIVILFVCMSKDVDFKLRSGSVNPWRLSDIHKGGAKLTKE